MPKFLHALCACLVVLTARAELMSLPQGEVKTALTAGYFPDRVHEFVWRNWNAVPPSKIADVLGATTEDVAAMATSMGLPPVASVAPAMRERGYVSLIRRNWHLLPYEQLLQLLDMTPEHLAVMLREEDFLWIKLGQLKPACEPLRYSPPGADVKARAEQIRRQVEEVFGDELNALQEPRFDFVRQLSEPIQDPPTNVVGQPEARPRIVYSYVALYGDPLMNPGLNPYPDGLLQRLAKVGINGVWLHALLRDLAPGGDAFPEFGSGHEERLANLRALVERAARYGIAIYLYINEPRAMPSTFFATRSDMAGVKEDDFVALCTSNIRVRQWMSDSLAHIFKEVPGLGGVYAITASENLTNCASHGGWSACDRCKARTDVDILSEVVQVIEEGVHLGNPQAKVLISDWGWRGHGDAREIIPRLPKSIWLMSVSEWSLPIERGGIASTVGEYSISSVGPGPRALPHWELARQSGMKTGAEIQFNNTCEIASLPYLPVLDLVAEHCRNLVASANPDAMFIGWTMGGFPSPNIRLAAELNAAPPPDPDTVLDRLARERFGDAGYVHARKAWKLMSDAFREYPFHISVVYTSPVQWGAANPLYLSNTGYSATMWGLPYDDLTSWRGPYPPEVFAGQFEKMAKGWEAGIAELEKAVGAAPPEKQVEAASDLRLARAAGIHFQSVANQAVYVHARDTLASESTTLSVEDRDRLIEEIRERLANEIVLARRLFTLTREDSRIGFEPSCQYFYLPLDLVEKVINCRWLLDHFQSKA